MYFVIPSKALSTRKSVLHTTKRDEICDMRALTSPVSSCIVTLFRHEEIFSSRRDLFAAKRSFLLSLLRVELCMAPGHSFGAASTRRLLLGASNVLAGTSRRRMLLRSLRASSTPLQVEGKARVARCRRELSRSGPDQSVCLSVYESAPVNHGNGQQCKWSSSINAFETQTEPIGRKQ